MVSEWMVLQTWQTFLHGKCMSYNPTVVSCLHWQGGTFSPMTCLIFWKLLWWCHLHNTTLQVQRIVRKLMVITDSLSRIGQIIYSNGLSIQQSFSMCAKLFVLVFLFFFLLDAGEPLCHSHQWAPDLHVPSSKPVSMGINIILLCYVLHWCFIFFGCHEI